MKREQTLVEAVTELDEAWKEFVYSIYEALGLEKLVRWLNKKRGE